MSLAAPPRGVIIKGVRSILNDRGRDEEPVTRVSTAIYKPESVIWRVLGDVVGMKVGGVSALLLQMLHPAALAGIWDHSQFRGDLLGRLRRTARFITVTTYASSGRARPRPVRFRYFGPLGGRGWGCGRLSPTSRTPRSCPRPTALRPIWNLALP